MAERDYLGHLDIVGRKIIKLIRKLEWYGVDWIGLFDSTGSASCCANGDEMCGFLTIHTNFVQMSNY